jgi:MFS superfamily sulfate permease-like transporter
MTAKRANKPIRKFDWSDFRLFSITGILMTGVGVLIFWATYTAPSGPATERYALSTTQRLVQMIPSDTQSKIAFVLAVMFMIFGLFLLLAAIFRGIKHLLFKK